MADTGKLQDYPGLRRWFDQRAGRAASIERQGEVLVYQTCEALTLHRGDTVRSWTKAFKQFLVRSPAPLADFVQAEQVVQECDAELVDLIGELGEEAVRHDHAAPFFEAMQSGADLTGLVFLRFLAAWTALNQGQLEVCVAECEKVDEPFASIFTIQGQALLELEKPKEAVEVLNVAVKLCPTELLAWFQLAKAHHVQNQLPLAFAALKECQRLAPQSDEVALYMAMIANEEGQTPALAPDALAALKPHLARHAGNGVVVFQLLLLTLKVDEKVTALSIVQQADWARIATQKDLLSTLSQTLKALHAKSWMDVAAELLKRVVPDGRRIA